MNKHVVFYLALAVFNLAVGIAFHGFLSIILAVVMIGAASYHYGKDIK